MDFIKIISEKRKITVLILSLLIIGLLVYCFIFKKAEKPETVSPVKEKTLEEFLGDLTAPSNGEKTEVSAEILESLTAPKKGSKVSEDIIKSLTAPSENQ